MRSHLQERAISIANSLDLERLKQNAILRDRNRYFLNISYPSLQAMNATSVDEVYAESNASTTSNPRAIALYVHIPFCSGLCSYCHYYKIFSPSGDRADQYLDALETGLELYTAKLGAMRAEAVYIGGGTPSHLSSPQVRRLIGMLRRHINIAPTVEISFEVHPENASPELFALLVELGVNRINIGVESFDETILKSENRRHTAAQAVGAFHMAESAGLGNVNLDTIYGLKGQTLDIWQNTLQTAAELRPASFCAYYLRTKKGTVDYRRSVQTASDYPNEEELLLMHIMTMEAMADWGYEQETVDWFVRDSSFYHTYQKYNWQRTDEVELLGVGASAYSYMNGTQYYNINDIERYETALRERRLPIWKGERLPTVTERMRRSLMLGLKSSILRERFRRTYGVDVVDAFQDEWDQLDALDLVDIDEDHVSLSYAGKLFADEVGRFFYSSEIRARMELVDPALISTTLQRYNP